MEISEGMRKFASLNNVSAYEVLLHVNRIGNFYGVRPVVHEGRIGWPVEVVDRKVLFLNDFKKMRRRA